MGCTMAQVSSSERIDLIASKRLSEVECNPNRSNQHEFNGTVALKQFFGHERRELHDVQFVFLDDDDDEEACRDIGNVTWYDAREQHPTRSEFRLYFTSNQVMSRASAGDLLAICQNGGRIQFVVASEESTVESQIKWLFGLHDVERQFNLFEVEDRSATPASFLLEPLLDQLRIHEQKPSDSGLLDQLIDNFGDGFPSSKVFSAFSRQTAEVSLRSDPDETIVKWVEHELRLFRELERHFVAERLNQGFEDDVDAFLKFSLSVHNRRKSRAGLSFENHLEQVFIDHQIRYSRGAKTERKSKPDFLFPGSLAYRDPQFPEHQLTMLGAKTTCKERWRQVLPEADRIPEKHLATLEAAISPHQTEEMRSQNLTLVVPVPVQATYKDEQLPHLMSIAGFLDHVKSRQT